MDLTLWILQGLLALVFLGSGIAKLVQPKAKLVGSPRMAWSNGFSQGAIRWIGIAEVLGALGLMLPSALRVLPWLTPLAALGLALIMAGAVTTHARRQEPVIPPLILGLLGLAVFIGRFWLTPL